MWEKYMSYAGERVSATWLSPNADHSEVEQIALVVSPTAVVKENKTISINYGDNHIYTGCWVVVYEDRRVESVPSYDFTSKFLPLKEMEKLRKVNICYIRDYWYEHAKENQYEFAHENLLKEKVMQVAVILRKWINELDRV